MDPQEREEPITIWVKGLSELAVGVQKTMCVQAMYERGQQGIPLAVPVDLSHLRPLIRGLPDALKIHVQTLRERVQRANKHKQQEPQNLPVHALTCADISQH